MTQKNQLTEKIVNAFAAQENTGFDKFRQVKSAVKTALKGEKEDTRFPSVRELAAALNMGTIPIQKAIMELTAENLLYSRNRVGIFVKAPLEQVKVPAVNLVDNLQVYAYEQCHFKREVLFRAVNYFQNKKCNVFATKLYFEDPGDASIFIQTAAPDPLELAGIKELLPWEIPCKLCGPHTAVIAYQAVGFMWNKELFAKVGIPEPAYMDYGSQKEYFLQLKKLISGKIISAIHPEAFVNKVLRRAVKEDLLFSPEEKKLLVDQLNDVIDFTGHLHYFYEKEDREATMALFRQQKLPGYFLNSTVSQGSRLLDKEKDFDFEVGFYPLFDIADCVMVQPVTFQIARKMEIFYQAFQFLQYLQEPTTQEYFLQENFATIHGQIPGMKELVPDEKLSCNFEEDPFVRYIMGSIVRSELLTTALQKNMPRKAVENIFSYTGIIQSQFKKQ